MTTICITGNHPHALTVIAAQLGQAGMAAAQPLQRDPTVTLQVWHQRVCGQSAGTIQPSRLWEQLAVDLMLANLDAPVWGWANPQSHQLLDFWAQLDGDIRFVLLCQTPKQAITHLLTGTSQSTGTAQALAEWQSHHQAMLRFHLRHPGQSVMVWADQAQSAPQALVQHLNQHWSLALAPIDSRVIEPSAATHANDTSNAVIRQLVSHIAALHPELDELDRELHATIAPLMAPPDQAQGEAAVPTSTINALIESYHRLTDRSTELAALQAQTEALTQRDQESKAKTTAQAQLKESQQEGELLLLQLHQVQEELEKHFLQNQDAQAELKKLGDTSATQLAALKTKFDTETKAKTEAITQRDALNGEKSKLTADNASLTKANADSKTAYAEETKSRVAAVTQRDQEAKAKTEALTQRDNEVKAKTTAQAQLKESQQEGELLLLQLHQVQEELEKHFLQNQNTQAELKKLGDTSATQLAVLKTKFDTETKAKTEAITQRDAETKAKTNALTQRDAEAKAKAEALAQRDVESKAKTEALTQRDNEVKAKTTAQAQLKESQQEGELLLLQLHQVQEELEKYYLQHQQAQRDVQTHSDRWNRLLKTQPDLCDFDAVELLSDGGDGQPLQWRLNNASLAGRSFNQLDFSMVIEDGVAGFVVRRTSSGASPLLRWPASAKTESELTIIPVNGGASAQRRAAHLVQLCASDWGLMLALPSALIQALQRGHLAITPARQQTLLKALGHYKHIMESMQGLVRFDRVSLTGQQSAGQRNVLAIQLEHTRFAKHTLASFAFQLQINKNAAGQPETAHFVFDEKTATAPFQTWANNMLNTAGRPVMAVRLDARGWIDTPQAQLTPDDQSFMSALTDSLAVVLITLQTDGARTDYPWQDWLKDATLLRQWSRQARLPVAPVLLPQPAEAPELPQPPEPTQATPPVPPAQIALTVKTPRKPRKAIAKSVVPAPAPAPIPTLAPVTKLATITKLAPKARRAK